MLNANLKESSLYIYISSIAFGGTLSEDLSVLDREVASVISSIPRGKVTTIKTIAESLGDKRATLAVFLSLKKLKNRGIEGGTGLSGRICKQIRMQYPCLKQKVSL
ncbi:MAG: hypothetical protein DSO07_06135 [Thermoproteota archaeon]|uniref:MGMT family protein n=1 Tax=Candidatus Methanodesulfokora washburnensis TaxID=2478471 RepID=A0A520KPU6_9CREN|nr:MAG: MGMT family protein [Candidatus Methanodesulfokores washburnensis]TDA41139.1 MAG: hypothetical protein DSO07_06135 [Candidatus Korarchaeota archaeon]